MNRFVCADCLKDFSSVEDKVTQEYFVYFKELWQKQAEKILARCADNIGEELQKLNNMLVD